MKRLIINVLLVLTLFGLIFILTGCGNSSSNNNGIVGRWKYNSGDYVYTFNEDGTGTYAYLDTSMELTYSTDGDKISILYKGNTAPFESTYSIEGDSLNIKDSFGSDTIYNREK